MSNRGTKEGMDEEISFVKLLNRKINLILWKKIGLEPNNHYAIHVLHNKFGKINQKKVKPKADVFIAKGSIPKNIIIEKDFYINEDELKELNLKPIPKTGISIKLKTSNRFQITKMGPNTFKKIFGTYELGAGASIYCQKEKDLKKNISVIEGWHLNNQSFIDFFKKKEVINSNEINIEEYKKIKKYSNNRIIEMINNNKNISQFIFQGIGNFEEPFTVHYLYNHGELTDSCYIPFRPTTGSGRSKGIYTIVIKPK